MATMKTSLQHLVDNFVISSKCGTRPFGKEGPNSSIFWGVRREGRVANRSNPARQLSTLHGGWHSEDGARRTFWGLCKVSEKECKGHKNTTGCQGVFFKLSLTLLPTKHVLSHVSNNFGKTQSPHPKGIYPSRYIFGARKVASFRDFK